MDNYKDDMVRTKSPKRKSKTKSPKRKSKTKSPKRKSFLGPKPKGKGPEMNAWMARLRSLKGKKSPKRKTKNKLKSPRGDDEEKKDMMRYIEIHFQSFNDWGNNQKKLVEKLNEDQLKQLYDIVENDQFDIHTSFSATYNLVVPPDERIPE